MKGKRRVSLIRTRGFRFVLFFAWMLFCSAILLSLRNGLMFRNSDPGAPGLASARTALPAHSTTRQPKVEQRLAAPPAVTTKEPPRESTVTDADLSYIASRNLLIPVANVTANKLHDSFDQARSEGRRHDAIDIMAPQGTPVLATTDGVVSRLFHSERGGVTLYELDPSGRYIYYYAHLERYADGIVEGSRLHRGDVIAYVGDTGNAGAGNYHLHFAISKITSPGKWSGGDPLNPYPLLVGG